VELSETLNGTSEGEFSNLSLTIASMSHDHLLFGYLLCKYVFVTSEVILWWIKTDLPWSNPPQAI